MATVYFNDQTKRISIPVRMGDIPEIVGDMSNEEFEEKYDGDIYKLNEDLYLISFTEEPEYDIVKE